MLAARDAVEEQRQVADLASVMQRKIETMPETQGRAKWGSSLFQQVQDENEMHQRRRDELESRISGLEAEYEELLGLCSDSSTVVAISDRGNHLTLTEKTIHDEEVSNVDIAESMSELKVSLIGVSAVGCVRD